MMVGILGVGFLGNQIASYLSYEGITPYLISRDPAKVLKWQKQGSQAFLLKPYQKSQWQELISHLDALVVTVAPTGGASYEETYLLTAQSLAKVGFEKPIYYCSSTSVYGEKQGKAVDETASLNPLSLSAKILVETEKIYQKRYGAIIRIGELWGFERRIENRLKTAPLLPGDGQTMTNLTHVTDAARAFVFLIKGGHQGIYNVCGKNHMPRKELYKELAARYNFPEPEWDPSQQSPHGGNKIVLSDKIRKLGFIFHHDTYI